MAAAALAALALGGCGGASDRAQVRDTLARFARATATKDYRTLCRRVLAPSIIQPLLQIGLSCEQALSRGLAAVDTPRMVVRHIEFRGPAAFAAVHTSAANQLASDDTVRLVEVDGQWVVSSLGAPPAAPARIEAVKSVPGIGPRHGLLAPAWR
jgi:hypothetical protein